MSKSNLIKNLISICGEENVSTNELDLIAYTSDLASLPPVIKQVYKKILDFFSTGEKNIKFSQLIDEKSTKSDKIHTFTPLLHLTNDRKIDLYQEVAFGDIEINLIDKDKVK